MVSAATTLPRRCHCRSRKLSASPLTAHQRREARYRQRGQARSGSEGGRKSGNRDRASKLLLPLSKRGMGSDGLLEWKFHRQEAMNPFIRCIARTFARRVEPRIHYMLAGLALCEPRHREVARPPRIIGSSRGCFRTSKPRLGTMLCSDISGFLIGIALVQKSTVNGAAGQAVISSIVVGAPVGTRSATSAADRIGRMPASRSTTIGRVVAWAFGAMSPTSS